MITGCSRLSTVRIPGSAGGLPLYIARDYETSLASEAGLVAGDMGAAADLAGANSAPCGSPGELTNGTVALVTWSWPFQPFFSWHVTRNIFCPGRGWPNRTVYCAVISHWPLAAAPNKPR